MRTYDVLLFDLFDTLLLFHRDRLPLVSVDGQEVRTSSVASYNVIAEAYPHIGFPEFYRAFFAGFQEAERLRAIDNREVTARERFLFTFERLGLPLTPSAQEVLERALVAHMGGLAKAMEFPPESVRVLEWAKNQYRIGMVSNFDHPPAAYKVIEEEGVKGFFEEIVISGDVGWRKPSREIFGIAFERMRIGPAQAIFVGDSPGIDVVGAKQVRMDVIWLNRKGEEFTDGLPRPDYTIGCLEELIRLL
ncbi:MAG: HAD family hydrolase [candidate division NC10 bacterium]|nr:HAD family hydrolase [candidate division NC10 bacterium]